MHEDKINAPERLRAPGHLLLFNLLRFGESKRHL